MRIGAHVDREDPVAEAAARNADVVQFFLGDPQDWRTPKPRADAETLRNGEIDIYIHAPYTINVATLNNRIRIPSRKLLFACAELAKSLGAQGLIVHGGHVTKGDDVAAGFDNWHAYSGGEDLVDIVDRVKAITGRIDLVHANGSKDGFDSGRDRHDNLNSGTIDPKLIVAVVRAAGAPVVVETPGGADGQGADIAYLREQLGQ